MLAIVYARVSTEDQARHGYSLPAQLEACRGRARELGATEIIECVDEGIPGEVLDRPGFDLARQALRGGGVAYFICMDPDRLARKLVTQLLLTEEIERAGAKPEFISYEWQDTPEGRMFYSIKGAFAEYERAKIVQRSVAGRREKAKQGKLSHPPRTYGYRFNAETDLLDIEPDEAKVTKLIFQLCAEGMGASSIATRLNELGIRPRTAPIWYPATIWGILKNHAYIGTLYVHRWECRGKHTNKFKPKEQRQRYRERDRSEWIPIPTPPIISEELWVEAQRQKDILRHTYVGQTKHDYLLSGIIRCGECGAGMCGQSSGGPKTKHKAYHYRCLRRSSKFVPGSCRLPFRNAEVLDRNVWSAICSWVNDPEAFCLAINGEAVPTAADEEIDVLKKQLETLGIERGRVITLCQKGLLSLDEAEKRLREIGERAEQVQTALRGLRPAPKKRIVTPNQAEAYFGEYREHLGTLIFPDRRKLVRACVEHVLCYADRMDIVARLSLCIDLAHRG